MNSILAKCQLPHYSFWRKVLLWSFNLSGTTYIRRGKQCHEHYMLWAQHSTSMLFSPFLNIPHVILKLHPFPLTHWGRVTHIWVGKLIIIGWDNGLSPDRRQAIISTNAWLLSTGPLLTYFSENLIKIQQFISKKMHMKMASAKWRPSCLGLNVLTHLNVF